MKTKTTINLGMLWALLFGAGTALATGPAAKTAEGDVLLASGGKSFVQPPGGDRVELPLPKASRISDFRSAAGEWLVAAVSRVTGEPALELLKGRGAEVEILPSPGHDPAAELREPIFVAGRQGGFEALVWLAGDAHNKMAVKASRWVAGGWAAPETISPPGAGTQIALATAVLDDGTWLVVWAAFDGTDDEILWSRFADGVWSQPRPIAEDNAVPDVTPSLFTTAGGALAAWSRFDGNDYRVNVARFDGQSWSAPAVTGPAGSTEPAFSDAETPYLIYHHAHPTGWAVMELDATGGVVREATLQIVAPQRPVLAGVSEKDVRFEWVGLERPIVSAPVAWVKR